MIIIAILVRKNLCMNCRDEHNCHDIIELSEFRYSFESKKELEEKIKIIENKINYLEEIKNNFINEIDMIKKSSELEMKVFKILLNTFKYEDDQNNKNYNVIKNIKNFDEIFQKYKIELIDRINTESKKIITLLNTSDFKESFKTINSYLEDYPTHLSKLKDGRLVSCFNGGALRIYNKNTFKCQLSINTNSDTVYYFTQLSNGNILTCSHDGTMKIIKLTEDNNEDNKYILEQNLTGHSKTIYKAIEIRDNVLISVSADKTMKIWNLNNNNKYECTKTINLENSNNFYNILKLNENEFVTSLCGDKCLKFWDSNNYSNISNINNIECIWFSRSLCKLDDDILCVGTSNSNGFYLIKISTYQVIKNITGPKYIWSIYKCLDGSILCSIQENNNNSLVKYKYENQNFYKIFEKENASINRIMSCVELDDEIIAAGGYDISIRLWRK